MKKIFIILICFCSLSVFSQTNSKAPDTTKVMDVSKENKKESQDTIIIKPVYSCTKGSAIVGYDTLVLKKDAILKEEKIILNSKK